MNTVQLLRPTFVDELLEAFDSSYTFANTVAEEKRMAAVMPAVDIQEKEDEYSIQMDVPGFSTENIDITLDDRVLTIQSRTIESEKKDEQNSNEAEKSRPTYLVKERRSRSFKRQFTLPKDINREDISAKVELGILTVSIPRQPATQPKRIAITLK